MLKGTKDIPRLTVHRGSEYIISRATFPCYFIKEQSVINHCYTEIDLKIFRQYGTGSRRYTSFRRYRAVLHRHLPVQQRYALLAGDPNASRPPIELVEIERLCFREMPISASWVRKLLVKRSHGYRIHGP